MQRNRSRPGYSNRASHAGDRIAIMMPNVMAYAPILFGILKAGLTVVNVNPLYTRRELSHQLNDFRREDPLRPGEFRCDGRKVVAGCEP